MKLVEFKEIIELNEELYLLADLAFTHLSYRRCRAENRDLCQELVEQSRHLFYDFWKRIKPTADYAADMEGYWNEEMEFAISIPSDIEKVYYIKHKLKRIETKIALFYKQESIDMVNKLLEQIESERRQIKELINIFEVMNT